VGGWTHKSSSIFELHFQEIPFRVKANFYFFGHMVSPGLS
jgi:hypothetical protein